MPEPCNSAKYFCPVRLNCYYYYLFNTVWLYAGRPRHQNCTTAAVPSFSSQISNTLLFGILWICSNILNHLPSVSKWYAGPLLTKLLFAVSWPTASIGMTSFKKQAPNTILYQRLQRTQRQWFLHTFIEYWLVNTISCILVFDIIVSSCLQWGLDIFKAQSRMQV